MSTSAGTGEDPQTILERTRQRGRDHGQPFAGEVTPHEAWTLLERLPDAELVDVRTSAERKFVGYPTRGVHVPWKEYPGMEENGRFLEQLRGEVGDPGERVLVFLCRSGGRSAKGAEAATNAGFTNCYNLLQGFEGDKDEAGHRGTVGGWKVAGLPWEQE